MRIVFVNRYFHPDHSATSQMVSDLAFHLRERGWEVAAISSRQRYDEPAASLPSRSREQGVDVRRVWSSRFGRANLLGRAVDYATFYVSAFLAMLREGGSGTVLVALTDPPLISVVAALAAKLRGTTLVNWTQDLFPEVARALGVRAPRTLERVRDWSLRRARTNVALGELTGSADAERGRSCSTIGPPKLSGP
jgi:colanic acid biosynthesis glycosyl transferase WcaI